jgi:hypothetical protein
MKRDRTSRNAAALLILFFVTIACLPVALAEAPSVIEVGPFSAETPNNSLPAQWEPLYFKNIEPHTDYRLVDNGGQVVIKATADASASGLIRKITIDPREYPIVQWRWKITKVLKKGNVHRKDGDDYPARLYILFKYHPDKLGFFEKIKYEAIKLFYGEYPPLASINYIWASNAPEDMVVPNPYTKKAMMFVVESGKKNLNRWLTEERNLYEDYRKAFKDEPPMISGVAIMTDTDNTGESATAWYGDILFVKERP